MTAALQERVYDRFDAATTEAGIDRFILHLAHTLEHTSPPIPIIFDLWLSAREVKIREWAEARPKCPIATALQHLLVEYHRKTAAHRIKRSIAIDGSRSDRGVVQT